MSELCCQSSNFYTNVYSMQSTPSNPHTDFLLTSMSTHIFFLIACLFAADFGEVKALVDNGTHQILAITSIICFYISYIFPSMHTIWLHKCILLQGNARGTKWSINVIQHQYLHLLLINFFYL
jgi:hypothetical protein